MMNKEERSALFSALSAVVRDYVDKSKQELTKWVSGEFKALTDLIDERFRSLPVPKDGAPGKDGKDADVEELKRFWQEQYSHIPTAKDWNDVLLRMVESVPKPKDGKDADIESVRAVVKQELAFTERQQISTLEVRDVVLPELMRAMEGDLRWTECFAKHIPPPKDGAPGKPGKDADMDAVQRMIAEHVKAAVDAIPKPTDGKDADLNEVKAFINSEVSRSVNALPKPNDGLPGKDGAPGKDGESIHPDTVRLMVIEEVKKEVTAIPKPKDGDRGLPGKDALSIEPTDGIDFEKSYVIGQWATHNGALWRCMDGKQWKCMVDGIYDVDESHDGERTITTTYRWASGKEKQFTRNTKEMKQRGIWQEGKEYAWGDVVTRGGSQWYCQVEKTTAGPKEHDCHDWVLIVQRGRDGKSVLPPPPKKSESIGLK